MVVPGMSGSDQYGCRRGLSTFVLDLVGRGGLERPTSAVTDRERCTYDLPEHG